MLLSFSPMSSVDPGGQKDVSINLSGYLEENEVLSTYSVTSGADTVLGVTAVNLSSDHKSIVFHLTVLTFNVTQVVVLSIAFTGDGGSASTYEIQQPLKLRLNE